MAALAERKKAWATAMSRCSLSIVSALAEFVGQDRRELRSPVADRLVAEHEAALEEHLAEVAQGQAVAQAPQHHEGDDV